MSEDDSFSIREHIIPDDENQKIWRYIDFRKYVSLLDRSELHFTRIDKLKGVSEGYVPKANLLDNVSNETENVFSTISAIEKEVNEKKDKTFICCFHLSEHESALMWNNYSKLGIAIQSTYKGLKDCFPVILKQDIGIGQVNYINYHSVDSINKIPEDDIDNFFLYKDFHYDDERELRVYIKKWIDDSRFSTEKTEKREKRTYDEECYIKVDLDKLIEKVYCAPDSPKWFVELVKSVSKKYGLNKKIMRSQVNSNPSDAYKM